MSSEVAAKTVLIATMAAGTLGRASSFPAAAVPVVAPPLVLMSTSRRPIISSEKYSDKRDRFIKSPDGTETWFEDAETQTKHLVRFKCEICDDPAPCNNAQPVNKDYIDNTLETGMDFSCNMMDGHAMQINPGFPELSTPAPTPKLQSTVTTTSVLATKTSTSASAAAAGSSFGTSWLFFLLFIACCFGVIAFAFNHFVTKKKKANKTKRQGKKRAIGAEEGVPLVQDDAPHFGSSNTGAPEQRTAMAPTYTGLTPQMGQAAMAAQQAHLPTYTHMGDQHQLQQGAQRQPLQMQHATMPTQAAMMGQTNMEQMAMQAQSWSSEMASQGQRESFVAAQAAMQTMVLEQPPAMQQAAMQTAILEQPPAMQQASMQTMVLEQPPGSQAQSYASPVGSRAQSYASPPGQGSFALGTQAAFPSMYQQLPQPGSQVPGVFNQSPRH